MEKYAEKKRDEMIKNSAKTADTMMEYEKEELAAQLLENAVAIIRSIKSRQVLISSKFIAILTAEPSAVFFYYHFCFTRLLHHTFSICSTFFAAAKKVLQYY